MPVSLDPITLSVIQNGLQQVCNEMDLAFCRAAFSPVISEGMDRSDGIYSREDGSLIAQLSNPDMRVPIAHALAHPGRIASGARPLDLASLRSLSFERPDHQRFPCLKLAYAALRAGGAAPAVLNAANEVAVEAFLAGRIRFTAIAPVIEDTLSGIAAAPADSLGEVLEADALARRKAGERIAMRQAA